MKIDDYDFEAVVEGLDGPEGQALHHLAALAKMLGLPGDPTTSWTAAPGLVSLAITVAAKNIGLRENISLDDAAATLLVPGTAKSPTQRCTGPRKNLAKWRKQVRTK